MKLASIKMYATNHKRRLVLIFMSFSLLLFLIAFGPYAYMQFRQKPKINSSAQYSGGNKQVIIIYGAGIKSDGKPFSLLQARLDKGAEMYNKRLAPKIIVSGDNRFSYYDEPTSMRNYLISIGIPNEDIVSDFAGRSTYETCYRAKNIFDIESAILVTQEYHLARALDACTSMGINVQGVIADGYYDDYDQLMAGFKIREVMASFKSLVQTRITKPQAEVMGEKIRI